MPITSPLGWWFRILQLASKSPTSLGLETSCRYMNQSRTILFNLKDPKNQTFSSKLLKGGGWVVGRAGRHLKEWCVTVLAVGFYTWRCHSWEMQVPSRSTVDAITQDRSCKLKKVTVKNYIYIYMVLRAETVKPFQHLVWVLILGVNGDASFFGSFYHSQSSIQQHVVIAQQMLQSSGILEVLPFPVAVGST